MLSAGIFGPKKSGKTTLARELSKSYWLKRSMPSLILDPHVEEHGQWGPQAYVTADEAQFWQLAWSEKNMFVICEEAATTIRRERDLIPVFTRLNHMGHVFVVVGHSGVDLLPTMRQQLDALFLFRQSEEAAKIWAQTFTQRELREAENLCQYEFIQTQLYGTPKKKKLQL
jgi:hypothetical protein